MSPRDPQVAVVTGGASGLGKAIADKLSSDGAKVVITDVQADLGIAIAEEHGFTFVQQDVCDEARWSEVIEDVAGRLGGVNILVNNAGILGPADVTSPEHARLGDWQRIFAVNVEGVFLGCRAAIPAMRRTGGGSIINMCSVAAMTATPYATAYGASKAAVRQLTKSVAQYCAQARLNIRCNSVHPGNVLTPLWERWADENARLHGVSADEIVAHARQLVPLGDLTLAEDVAAAVSFLASEQARHITGAMLPVDGGYLDCDTYHQPALRPTTGADADS
jgi:3(or 17)beta-hydroxysteroid dehydrogenase